MPIRKLRETLEQLHKQLESADQLDAEERAQLRATMQEIQATLAGDTPNAANAPANADADADAETNANANADEHSPLDRLRDLVEHFEGDHPTLSRRLAELVNSMHNLGF